MKITTYPPSWVVMQNNIQECFKSMSVNEKRLLILSSPLARTQDATEKDAIIITAEDFSKECGITQHSAYAQLEKASKALIKRYFSYHNEKNKKVLSKYHQKKFICIETGIIYNSPLYACKELNIDYSYLTKCCKTGKICKGYHFKYIDKENS